MARACAGNGEAFDALVQAHCGTAYAIGLALLRNPEEAEDLTQEVFLRAFLQLDQLRDGEKFGPWLGRMVRNLAIDWQRRGANRQRLAPQVPFDELLDDPPDKRRPDIHQRLEAQGPVASRLKTTLRKLRGALEPLMREGFGSLRPHARFRGPNRWPCQRFSRFLNWRGQPWRPRLCRETPSPLPAAPCSPESTSGSPHCARPRPVTSL